MKYGVWNAAVPEMDAVNTLVRGGYAPLAAMVLASRGIKDERQAHQYLDCSAPLPDPFLLTDMNRAAARVTKALETGEKIAIFGDYDVDGITSTCLLTDFLRQRGADCVPYIPGRLEEGYGLNPIAIHQLHQQGVTLIITVDCGITAMDEADLCRSLGIDLVITDHHECKDTLPAAVAIVDPHRPDGGYPHRNLSGVGVAFKLASALCGSQEQILQRYADMVCLGTVADVMPLQGENRVFVARGLEVLQNNPRPGLAALMAQCGCERDLLNASSVGYMLSPRINAAGRMGKIDLAVELFLTQDAAQAEELAKALCELNRQRQTVESDIYRQAVEMLPEGRQPEAIVLADENWHQGGFNLFSSLTALSSLLESYGGHELAAGFTIHRTRIADFREQICALAREYYTDDSPRTVLDADCIIPPEMLTLSNIESLSSLEPCGNGCPKPVLIMEKLTVDRISQVGNGRHMRLRLRCGRYNLNAIYFSATPESASIAQGDLVDVAFLPQINEFRGERTAQMNVLDIRPSCKAECSWESSGYRALCAGTLRREQAQHLLPDRSMLSMVWRYLAGLGTDSLQETPMCLCRKIVRWADSPLSLGQLLTCLDIFADVGLLQTQRLHKNITIRLMPRQEKADLQQSRTMQQLLAAKES